MLQLETSSRLASESYYAAKRQVSRYERTKNPDDLDSAIAQLNRAITADANFFKPAHYKGIVLDMKGKPSDAITQFEFVLQNVPDSRRNEVEYNKAVANYHSYGESFIADAIGILKPMETRLSRNTKLSLLAKAVLAQSYAMMVLHSMRADDEEKMNSYAKAASAKANEAISNAESLARKFDKSFLNQPHWIANNAIGVSLMFRDDNIRDGIHEENHLQYKERQEQAIQYFDKASRYSSDNWALECNQASARMRLGHMFMRLGQSDVARKYFDKAEAFLKDVITRLRPNYDFALYELGRIHRFQKNKTEAIAYFNRALSSGTENRNIKDSTLRREKLAAEEEDIHFKLDSREGVA
jgi:tetratricopeptide (TPR) repeat protein